MSSMWEVDPETKVKLLQLSKTNGNEKCCDCGAPAPQWASPKFGTFICLNCAGTHRGLGVHISFVRSITMDAFKHAEIQRMEMGGNEPWKTFFDEHPITQSEGRTFEDSTIKERYEGEVGEEWKERLAAKVEGREYVPGAKKTTTTTTSAARAAQSKGSSGASTPLSNTGSPALSGGGGAGMEGFGSDTMSKKERNEAYFAKMGSENATRSETLPPSQGGKYTGFGGGMPPTSSSSSSPARRSQFGAVTGFEDFQKDPVATLSKGFGWFASAVGKGAKTMNNSYIQPTAKTIAESDFAAQARMHAMQVGQNVQLGARGAADSFNRFVEGPEDSRGRTEPERKDFWDDFSSIASQQQQQQQQDSHRRSASRSSALGTSAMKKQDTPGPGAASSTGAAAPGKEKDDGWDDNW